MNRLKCFTLVACLLLATSACNRSGEIKVKNSISKTTIENIYWGDVYIGGALKPGQETEFTEIKRSEAKLPSERRIYFSVEADEPIKFYTSEYYSLERKAQLFIELTDTTEFFEVER